MCLIRGSDSGSNMGETRMPVVAVRKVLSAGNSRVVTLPPGWLDAAGLALGDDVLVIADGAVLIVPQGMRVERSQIDTLVEVANRKNSSMKPLEAAIKA
jgi:antitoxin component of MazEF toxin-antitoxin module